MPNHGCTYRDTVPAARAGLSVSTFYEALYPRETPEIWPARLRAGEISLNGAPCREDVRLRAGDRLAWHRPPWEEPPVPMDVKVVYEDDDLLAVDKPAGLPVLPAGGFLEHTLLHWLETRDPAVRPVPVHRLGRGTSGLLLCAKTECARADLAAQFRDLTARAEGALCKTYLARTAPFPGARPGLVREVTVPIGPVPHPRLGSVHAATPNGRPARSICTVVAGDDHATLWEVEIPTGRPHQIRIHLAALGVPLLGDPLYQQGGIPRPDAVPGQIGYFLRCVRLVFRHPATGKILRLQVP